MNFQQVRSFTFIIFSIAACATPTKISSIYERGVDFSQYRTYQLLAHEPDFSYGMNPINQLHIERAIQREMMTMGFKIDPSPDLIVACFVKEKLIRKEDHYYQGYYRGWGFPIWVDINHYKEGTLVIDLIDRRTKQVVWHGATATERISDDMPNLETTLNRTVQALFEKFYEDSHQRVSVAMIK